MSEISEKIADLIEANTELTTAANTIITRGDQTVTASAANAATAVAGALEAQGWATLAQASTTNPGVVYDTLAALNANLTPAANTMAQVIADGANNGLYVKVGASGTGSWSKKSDATIPGLDAATQFGRAHFVSSDQPAFEVEDPAGFAIARFDADGLRVPGVDMGGVALRSDSYADFFVDDPAGFVSFAVKNGIAYARRFVATEIGGSALGDYSAAEIAARSARAVGLSAAYNALIDTTSAAAIWTHNHVLWYGQSLCAAQEGWPAKSASGRSDVLMIGQSTRPGGANTATSPSPLGDSALRPAIATVQSQGTGALLDPAAVAALAPGSDALGEDPGVAGMQFARRLYLQGLGVQAADDRKFVTTNIGVSGRTIEELSKGSTIEFFNRLRTMSTAVKNAATSAGGSYGIAGVFWLQGEWNYNGANGGTTDKATYKTKAKQFYDDVVADVCVGIAGQTEKPAIITYQTGGQYTVDATGMSIGMAQWELSQENPSWYLAAPAYPVTDKGGHLDPNGYRWLGLQMGKVWHHVVVQRRRWKPLSPLRATLRGRTVLVDFHLPSGTPLQWQPVYVASVATTYTDKGFTVIDTVGVIPLDAVLLGGDACVQLSLGRAPVGAVDVYYGRKTTFNGGGNLCDSDPTIAPFTYQYSAGSGDYAAANIADLVGKPYPLWNWCIAFKISATAD